MHNIMGTTKFKVTTYIMEMFRAVRLKKFFLFFTLTPSLFAVTGWQTVIKGVRVSVRAAFLPSHFPSPLPLTPTILPAGRHPACHGDSMGVKEAAVYRAYSYAALSVQLCCTLGARWLHFSGTIFLLVLPMLDYRYTYAVLSVYLCWTFGTRMLYSSGTVFSICLQAISRRIKSSFFVLL